MKHTTSVSTRSPGNGIDRRSSRPEAHNRNASLHAHRLPDSLEMYRTNMLVCISVLGVLFGQCGAYMLFHALCLQQEALCLILVGALGLLVWILAMAWLARLRSDHSDAASGSH
jgi:hypothetical protein